MNKLRFLFLGIISMMLFGCASVSPKLEYIQPNGNYVDDSFSHTVSITKVNVLNEFGITQIEWDNYFSGITLYKAYSAGNAFASKAEVEQRAYDAIQLYGSNLGASYYGVLGKM